MISFQEAAPPTTGPEAIRAALARIDLNALEKEQMDLIRAGKKTKRPRAVRILNAIQGMRRNEMTPADLMVKKIPVIPAAFRPFSSVGDTFIPGDANELYRDLINLRNSHQESEAMFGDDGDSRLNVYDAVKAVYGFGDPVEPKTRQRGVSGFMKKIVGNSPKTGYVQRKLLSKPMDSVSRGTIVVDPDLNLDEIGIPEEHGWKMFSPHIQRRLVQGGMPAGVALRNIMDRTEVARRALNKELAERPVVYSRAPAWHKFSVLAGNARLVEGDAIKINPLVTSGLGADFDGDAMNIHVPATSDSVTEAREKLMPSKMLYSIRDMDKVVPTPKHEMLLGLNNAQKRKAGKKHTFLSESEAIKAIESGKISFSDEVEITPDRTGPVA